MLVIKKMTEEKLASLHDTAALEAILPKKPADCLAGGETVFVMLLDDKAVGALMMDGGSEGTSPAYVRVSYLAVLPDLRRHGLGRMLMCTAAGEAVGRKVWFLGCGAQLTGAAAAFASAMHFRAGRYPDTLLLDLSDVEGMRHG